MLGPGAGVPDFKTGNQWEGNSVVIKLLHRGGRLTGPAGQGRCGNADTALPRSWRHYDTMPLKTEIRAIVPRCRYAKCGVTTIALSRHECRW